MEVQPNDPITVLIVLGMTLFLSVVGIVVILADKL